MLLLIPILLAGAVHYLARRTWIQSSLIAATSFGVLATVYSRLAYPGIGGVSDFVIPIAGAFLVGFPVALLVGIPFAIARMHSHSAVHALSKQCQVCGYSLIANTSGICPECGTRFCSRCGNDLLGYFTICPECG